MKKVIKSIAIVLTLLFCVSFIVLSNVNAFTALDIPIDDVTSGDAGEAGTSIQSAMGAAVVIAQIIAAGVAVIMLLVLAMKYMSAAPSEKAEIKKHAVIYVVGAIVMFAVTGILQIIKQFSDNFNG